MGATTVKGKRVAKKKADGDKEPKRYGTLIRVSDAFAEALRDAASFERLSMAEFADAYLLPVTQKRYRDAIVKEAKRVGGES